MSIFVFRPDIQSCIHPGQILKINGAVFQTLIRAHPLNYWTHEPIFVLSHRHPIDRPFSIYAPPGEVWGSIEKKPAMLYWKALPAS